jgi:hypothetical protein
MWNRIVPNMCHAPINVVFFSRGFRALFVVERLPLYLWMANLVAIKPKNTFQLPRTQKNNTPCEHDVSRQKTE